MSQTILLYGATGYSGRLIAAEGARTPASTRDPAPAYRMILAGRDGAALRTLANDHCMDYRVFGLDYRDDVLRGLRGVDVLINAAGPFAWTAERLAKVALEADVDYVDINGEVDVYRRLDDLGRCAAQLGRAMVCGAGHTAGASDLLLDAALKQLRADKKVVAGDVLGSVRIAMSRIDSVSRGSVQTVWRSLREQVTVVRGVEEPAGRSGTGEELALWHEPVGKLERTFDFRDHGSRDGKAKRDLRIASAADLVDTLTARLALPRHGLSVRRIESYVEIGTASRIVFQLSALLAPVAVIPGVAALAQAPIGLLPAGPTKKELENERHVILLEIEDAFRTRIVDWRWETPNVYQFTAQIVVAVAGQLAKDAGNPHRRLTGWRTPAEVLRPVRRDLTGDLGALRGCRLDDRSA